MFGNKAQMQNMLKKARKMQEEMKKLRKSAEELGAVLDQVNIEK